MVYDVAGLIIVTMTAEQAARWNAGEMENDEMDALHAISAADDDYATKDMTIGILLRDGVITEDDLRGEPAQLCGD